MFIALAMTFTFMMSASVYAMENSALKPPNNSDITSQQKTIEDQLEAYLTQPDKTPEQKQVAIKKAELAQSLTSSADFPKTYSTRALAKALAVPFLAKKKIPQSYLSTYIDMRRLCGSAPISAITLNSYSMPRGVACGACRSGSMYEKWMDLWNEIISPCIHYGYGKDIFRRQPADDAKLEQRWIQLFSASKPGNSK